MADVLTKEQRKRNMQGIKSKNTKIEVILRKALWERGIRYRKNYDKLPGKPDIVLTKYKIAIFCDSEFFHGKDWEVLKPRLEKGENSEFWVAKISRNRERDDEVNKRLLFMGWTVIRFWGDDIKKKTEECIRVIQETIFEIKVGEDELGAALKIASHNFSIATASGSSGKSFFAQRRPGTPAMHHWNLFSIASR